MCVMLEPKHTMNSLELHKGACICVCVEGGDNYWVSMIKPTLVVVEWCRLVTPYHKSGGCNTMVLILLH